MKRKFGDRRDGTLIRDADGMFVIMPQMYPNRCDNEAFLSDIIDMEPLNAFLAEKNASNPEIPYKMFHAVVTAMAKTLTLRPKMNRFIANKNYYQRNEVTCAFTVKKVFDDDGAEALTFYHAKEDDNLESLHNEIVRQVTKVRSGDDDDATNTLNFLGKLPRFLVHGIGATCRMLDRHGWMPKFIMESDPYQSSCVLANVGSIKVKGAFHHLTNWGTTSLFCLIGEKKKRPFFEDDGTFTMRDSIEVGFTIDERIADGYYYSRSIQLFKKLLEEPAYLDQPLNAKVEF